MLAVKARMHVFVVKVWMNGGTDSSRDAKQSISPWDSAGAVARAIFPPIKAL